MALFLLKKLQNFLLQVICNADIIFLVLVLLGGLAQLGERLHGMQEVVGSIPIVSIFQNLCVARVFLFCKPIFFTFS